VKVGQGNDGYKTIEEFLPEAAECNPARVLRALSNRTAQN
jgi:hypothetical protein